MIGLGLGIGVGQAGVLAKLPFPSLTGVFSRWAANLGVTTVGGPVSAWSDQSGASHDLAQATPADQPTSASSKITFNGTTDYMARSVRDQLASGSMSILACVRTSDTRATRGYAGNPSNSIVGDTSGSINDTFGITGGKVELNLYNGGWHNLAGVTSVNDGTPRMVGATLNNTTGAYQIIANGAVDASGTQTENAGSLGYNAIGGSYNGSSAGDCFNGDLLEIVILDHVASSTELAQLHAYFQSNYGAT